MIEYYLTSSELYSGPEQVQQYMKSR